MTPRTLLLSCALLAVCVSPLQAQAPATGWLTNPNHKRAATRGDLGYARQVAQNLGGKAGSVQGFSSPSSRDPQRPAYKAVVFKVDLARDNVVVMRLRTRSEAAAQGFFQLLFGIPAAPRQRVVKVLNGKQALVLWCGERAGSASEAARRLKAAWGTKQALRSDSTIVVNPPRGSDTFYLARCSEGGPLYAKSKDPLRAAREADAKGTPKPAELERRWLDARKTDLQVSVPQKLAMRMKELDEARTLHAMGTNVRPLTREWSFFVDFLARVNPTR